MLVGRSTSTQYNPVFLECTFIDENCLSIFHELSQSLCVCGSSFNIFICSYYILYMDFKCTKPYLYHYFNWMINSFKENIFFTEQLCQNVVILPASPEKSFVQD